MLMGQHVSLLGTELLFSEAPAAGTSAGATQGESPLAPHQAFAARARVYLCMERTTVANLARADDNNEHPHERAPQGKKPLVHVANTEHRIRFKEVELKPKIPGASPSNGNGKGHGGSATPTAKTSNLAKKVNMQMEHVMSGSGGGAPGGSSRRGRGRGRGGGRGGRKRGATDGRSKTASSRSKPRGSSDQEGDDDAVDAELAEGEDVERGDADAVDESASASMRMDTSA